MRNGCLMQYFEWYLPNDGQHWNRLKADAQHLQDIGITKVWLPPAFKATSANDVGYGVYDLYDLGEFDQKNTVRTKYGTKDEYIEAIRHLKEVGIDSIADIVLNHKAAADHKERVTVLEVDPLDRQKVISEPEEIEGWVGFDFPGRNNVYSDFKWHWYHFSGIDYDALNNRNGIFMITGDFKGWAHDEVVDNENGNYDYLMYADIDFSHPEVVEHIHEWAKWFINTTGVSGFRLDAIKHIDQDFMRQFIEAVLAERGESFYVFGEYWKADYEAKLDYLSATNFKFDLVDVGLHMNLFNASCERETYDLTQIFEGTLMQGNPQFAVTFVDNHDTQRGQALESTVEEWFKPLAYAIILLREQGLPCVFYGDYYGIEGEYAQMSFQTELDKLLFLRKNHAYGEQIDYLDEANCIGWTRLGTEEFPNGLAVVISNGEANVKRMNVGALNAGKIFKDYLANNETTVHIDEEGWGEFPVEAMSVSVWAVASS
ncbi:alpha-amylase [Aerococcaceae bacterium NML201209]|nr:alpha-amylase [Aerococcaceae bacterium NML201209]MCW6662666.1 alpha-amylase [Aerococcaceae bacterium NML190073]MCW6680284.1 alpha-amylase [Aerococcaceae bacterium NML130460]